MTETYYYIMTFDSTKDAIAGEAFAKAKTSIAIMPVPQEISSGCGLALRFPGITETDVIKLCRTFPIPCTLYKMGTQRINGAAR